MASWTRYVGIFTIVLAGVATASAIISYQTLTIIEGQLTEMQASSRETQRLIDAAQRTSEAARNTVEVSKQTAEKELRAYVSVENFLVMGIKNKVVLFIRFRNAGQTPAYKLSIEGSLVLGTSNQALYKIPTGLGPSKITLGRNMVTSAIYEIDVSKHKDFIAKPESNILMFGKVTYRDVFGNLRTTRYMFKRAPRTGNLWAMSAAPEGNEAD